MLPWLSAVVTRAPRRPRLLTGGAFLRQIEGLTIAARRLLGSTELASRAGMIRGGRSEFLEHRGYVPGDDLRDLDWNVLARTGETFVKVFGAERRKRVLLLLDLSPSMTVIPEKEMRALRLCGALGHIALAAGDSVGVQVPGAPVNPLPVQKGLGASRGLLSWLEQVSRAEAVDWPAAVAHALARLREPAAVLVLSDFWSPDPIAPIAGFARAGHEVALLQVLSQEEIAPSEPGAWQFVDAESGEELSLELTHADLDAYRSGVENYLNRLRSRARAHGCRHLLCPVQAPLERLVLSILRAGGVLRASN